MNPEIKYARTSDGVSIAYFAIGTGPLLIDLIAPPFGHADLMWQVPEYREQLEDAARQYTYVHYDQRGFGLSDRDVREFSLAAVVRDLEAVADTMGRDRFAIGARVQCSMPALAYAASHPERVIAMALREGLGSGQDAIARYGGMPLDRASDDWDLFRRSMADRTRNILSVAGLARMDELIRRSVTPDTFVRYVRQWQTWNVFDVLDTVTMPVLVTNDGAAPRDASRRLAAALPQGSFVTNDVPRGQRSPSEDAWRDFLARAFAAEPPESVRERKMSSVDARLTSREVEVLKLVVAGKSGKEIASDLVLSPRTVERHIANIYRKTETHGRAQLAAFALRQHLV